MEERRMTSSDTCGAGARNNASGGSTTSSSAFIGPMSAVLALDLLVVVGNQYHIYRLWKKTGTHFGQESVWHECCLAGKDRHLSLLDVLCLSGKKSGTRLGWGAWLVVVGNSLVVAAVFTHAKLRRSTTNRFIVSLAVADLMVGLLVLPFSSANEVSSDKNEIKCCQTRQISPRSPLQNAATWRIWWRNSRVIVCHFGTCHMTVAATQFSHNVTDMVKVGRNRHTSPKTISWGLSLVDVITVTMS